MKQIGRWLLIGAGALIAVGVSMYLYMSGGLSLESLQQYGLYYRQVVDAHYYTSVTFYLISYALVVVTGIPLFLPFTLLGGYLFGLFWGTIYVVIAANVGAVGSFLLMRYVFYSLVAHRYADRLARFKQQVSKQGYAYMLTIHLAMVFPYIVINTLAALSGLPLFTFIWTTMVGSFPLIFLYVFAGQQLQYMSSLKQVIPSYVWPVLGIILLLVVGLVIIRSHIKRREPL